jgi:transcriptional regulator
MGDNSIDLLRGTVDMLLLRALKDGPRHGYGMADWIRGVTDDALSIDDGALYTALHRMEDRGLVRSDWGVSDRGRRARFYELTAAGRAELVRGGKEWEAYAGAVSKVFAAEAGEA